jgi:hypothetical protein
MTTQQVMQVIEQLEFSAYLNVASSYKVLVRLLESHDAVNELRGMMARDEVPVQILCRLRHLARAEQEVGLQHPWDAAMAAYMWLLSKNSEGLAVEAAVLILNKCHHCWWARKVAQQSQAKHPHPPILIHSPSGIPHSKYALKQYSAAGSTSTRLLPQKFTKKTA